MTRKLHLFDLDKTLVRVNTSFAFGKFLYLSGYITFSQMIKVVAIYGRHHYLGLSIQKTHQKIFSHLFKDYSSELMDKHVSMFLNKHIDQLFYEPALSILKKALESEDYVAILSSGPNFLVDPITKLLQIHYGAGTEYVCNAEGAYLKVGKVLEGENKAEHGIKLRNELGIAVENVVAYSDSWLDLPLLESVGVPVAVNPDKNLKAISIAKRWRII